MFMLLLLLLLLMNDLYGNGLSDDCLARLWILYNVVSYNVLYRLYYSSS